MLEPKDPKDWIWPDDWSRDGQLILYDLISPNCGTSNSKVTAQRIYIFNEQLVAGFLPMRAGSHMFLTSQE